jgi:uncharacterized membrane protein
LPLGIPPYLRHFAEACDGLIQYPTRRSALLIRFSLFVPKRGSSHVTQRRRKQDSNLCDENVVFLAETGQLAEANSRSMTSRAWIAGMTAFKAVLLEGLEVVFIVIAVGSGPGLLWPAALGALAACAAVLGVGAALHKPLARVPENTLKFGVGVLLSAFGVFWTGEGLGISWPGQDLALAALAVMFLLATLASVSALRRPAVEVLS